LQADTAYTAALAHQIETIREKIRTCSICGSYTETDPCPICTDPNRDRSLICVVEQSQDVKTIEQTNEFHGLFHVLNGVISPLDGVGPDDLLIGKLMQRVKAGNIREVIIATNPTIEGDTTALYLVKLLKETGVAITRLASGLPVGGDLEYADKLTLARSLKGRIPYGL